MVNPPPPWIGRQAAQQLARRELSKAIYHPAVPFTDRVLGLLLRWLARLHTLAGRAPGGWWAVVGLTAIAVIVAAVVLARVGPVARARRSRAALTAPGQFRTARDHRREARLRAEAGDYASAIRESLRAIAAELDERGVLPSRPGWTADEFAREAGLALPAQAGGLRDAAALFDEVCYGQRPGSAEGYELLRALGAAVSAGAPRVRRAGDDGPEAVPVPAAAGGTGPAS